MAMTDTQLRDVARVLAERIYAAATADCDGDQLKNAVGAIDTAMETTCTTIGVQGGAALLKVALRNYAQVQAPNLTNTQAALALAYWAMKEVGLI